MSLLEHRLKIVQSESERIAQHLKTLPTEAWNKASACDDWTVADVVAHIGGDASIITRRLERALQGDYSPPDGAASYAEYTEETMVKGNDEDIKEFRERVGNNLASGFLETNNELNQLFTEMAPEDWKKLCYWPPGPEPASVVLDIRITELAMHEWDYRSRLDSQWTLPEDTLPVLIDTVPRAVRRAFRPDPALSTPIRYRFVVTGPVPTRSDLVFTREDAYIEPASTDEANVTFHCATETYLLVIFGRVGLDEAIAGDRMTFDGNADLVTRFGLRFQGG